MKTIHRFPHAVRVIENCWIPMSDGCRLAARVWLPADAETTPVPAILEYIPYRKNDMTLARDAVSQQQVGDLRHWLSAASDRRRDRLAWRTRDRLARRARPLPAAAVCRRRPSRRAAQPVQPAARLPAPLPATRQPYQEHAAFAPLNGHNGRPRLDA